MTDVTNGAVIERLDQSIADFKLFMAQRFTDQNTLLDERDVRQTNLLDERFETQTAKLDDAFAAAETARQEARATAKDDAARIEMRIKAAEDALSGSGGRALGRSDVIGWMVAAAAIGGLLARLVLG